MEMTENEQAKHGHGVIIWNVLHRQLTFSTEQLQQTTEVAAVRVVPKKGLLLVIVSKDSVKAMNTINSHNFHNISNHYKTSDYYYLVKSLLLQTNIKDLPFMGISSIWVL